jgi:hypothetical protein
MPDEDPIKALYEQLGIPGSYKPSEAQSTPNPGKGPVGSQARSTSDRAQQAVPEEFYGPKLNEEAKKRLHTIHGRHYLREILLMILEAGVYKPGTTCYFKEDAAREIAKALEARFPNAPKNPWMQEDSFLSVATEALNLNLIVQTKGGWGLHPEALTYLKYDLWYPIFKVTLGGVTGTVTSIGQDRVSSGDGHPWWKPSSTISYGELSKNPLVAGKLQP